MLNVRPDIFLVITKLSGANDVGEVLKALNRFYKRKEMQKLASEHGLDGEDFTSPV